MPHPTVLVLGLEGTLYAGVGGPLIARPYLHLFLSECALLFPRIAVYPDDLDTFDAFAQELVRRGEAPEWFANVERIEWAGEGSKDLRLLGVSDVREVRVVEAACGHTVRYGRIERVSVPYYSGGRQDGGESPLLRAVDALQFDPARLPPG
jgi:hypothetical protein